MLQIQESYVDATKGHLFGETEWYTPFTEDRGRLYRELTREYGRCTGKVYRDMSADGAGKVGPVAVGWVFVKRMAYDGARRSTDTYLREVWVTLRHVEESVEESV